MALQFHCTIIAQIYSVNEQDIENALVIIYIYFK